TQALQAGGGEEAGLGETLHVSLINYLVGVEDALQKNRVYDTSLEADPGGSTGPSPKALEEGDDLQKAIQDIDNGFSRLADGADLTADLSHFPQRSEAFAQARTRDLLRTTSQCSDELFIARPGFAPTRRFLINPDFPCPTPQELPMSDPNGTFQQAN